LVDFYASYTNGNMNNEYSTEELKIYNFTLTVSAHYLMKLKPHKTAHF